MMGTVRPRPLVFRRGTPAWVWGLSVAWLAACGKDPPTLGDLPAATVGVPTGTADTGDVEPATDTTAAADTSTGAGSTSGATTDASSTSTTGGPSDGSSTTTNPGTTGGGPTGGPYAPCGQEEDCAAGEACIEFGHCSEACNDDSSCPAAPPGAGAMPVCIANTCALSCRTGTCPRAMICQAVGNSQLCVYPA